MSFNTTIDNLIYSQTTQPENIAEKPFVSKEWTNPIFDTNTSASYNSNQIIFDTTTLANSGQMPNYAEGMIILPVVIRVSCNNNNDWSELTNARPGTDFMLALKNSHVQIVHSIGINMNNMDILQPVPLSNAYLTFIQHSELSTEDELLNSPLHGYCKDSSSSWSYVADNPNGSFVGDSRGVGLCNNSNFGLVQGLAVNDTYNEGMFRRQKLINKYSADKILILGDEAKNSTECKSYVLNTNNGKYYFYDVVLRLKDLAPHFFPNFPLTTGVKFKITLTLNNNISFQFSKNINGAFVFNPATFSNVSSATNPIMIASSYNPVIAQTGGVIGVTTVGGTGVNTIAQGTYQFNLTDASTNTAIIPCGSSCLACVNDDVYTVSMKIGNNNALQHVRAQCILYVPSYRLSPKYEAEYFSKDRRIRKVHYTELEYNSFYCEGNKSFNFEISSTCVRPKRLIMIPILTAAENFGINPISSPFTTEPATTSPYVLTAFNCSIANNNIYPNDINFSYDNFLQALNGSTGVNANLVNGLVSSRINLTDYQNNYHYIVCDLSRRLPEFDMVSVSIRVRGQVQSPKRLEFHCFIEKEKVIEVDTMTGALISRS